MNTENVNTTESTDHSERMKELASRGDSRSQRPSNEAFREFISSGWDETVPDAARLDSADFTPPRRDALVRRLPATRLVLPAGVLKVRSNDTDYPFRPDTAFAYYSGLGTDEEPDSVLVVEPTAEDPQTAQATYFFRPRAGFDTSEFYADARYGEMWVGRRPTLTEASQRLGIEVRHIDELRDHLAKDVGAQLSLSVMPSTDAAVEAMVEEIRAQNGLPGGDEAAAENAALKEAASEQRLIKDEYEVGQMREADRCHNPRLRGRHPPPAAGRGSSPRGARHRGSVRGGRPRRWQRGRVRHHRRRRRSRLHPALDPQRRRG